MTHLIELALTLLAAYGSNGRTADTMGRTRRASIKASLCELDRGTQAWRVSAPWLPKRSTMPGDPATRNHPEKFRRLPPYGEAAASRSHVSRGAYDLLVVPRVA